MRERHSYGNGFRRARRIGILKLKHQEHQHRTYWEGHGKALRYHSVQHQYRRNIPTRAGGYNRD